MDLTIKAEKLNLNNLQIKIRTIKNKCLSCVLLAKSIKW